MRLNAAAANCCTRSMMVLPVTDGSVIRTSRDELDSRNAELMPFSEAVLAVRVIPRARRSSVAGMRGDAWLIRLQAPPVDGAANEELVALLSRVLGVPKRDVTIVSGERSREKRVRV